jgi:hypothetical protein
MENEINKEKDNENKNYHIKFLKEEFYESIKGLEEKFDCITERIEKILSSY